MTTEKSHTGSAELIETYKPQIIYTYDDNQKTYTYNTISYSDSGFTDKSTASQELDKYPDINEPVTLYLSPDKNKAVLKSSVSSSSYILLIGSGIFSLIGLYGFKSIWL